MSRTHLGRATLVTATIPAGAALSEAVNLEDKRLHQILLPAAWQAAPLSFRTSADGTAFYDVADMSGEHRTVQMTGGRAVILEPEVVAGLRFIQLRSGTSDAPVIQAAAREIGLLIL